MDEILYAITPLIVGFLLDLLFADSSRMPHPVVGFGYVISFGERHLNCAKKRFAKGLMMTAVLVIVTYLLVWWLVRSLAEHPSALVLVEIIGVYFCLAGTCLRSEVKQVFDAAARSLDDGRRQVSRIVGRDTASLSDNEVKTAALETLAENLSDGVVAPLFWWCVLGLPGMMTYKMINTLDSMIGYKSDRYKDFGCVAARVDDVANYVPARITAALIAIMSLSGKAFRFILKYGHCHASPNSGYPEAAMAGLLDCRFGGTHDYFGQAVFKPYIGHTHRKLTLLDADRAIRVCLRAEVMAVVLSIIITIVKVVLLK